MRSQSPLLSPISQNKAHNFLTPSRIKHLSQNSTGQAIYSSPQAKNFQQKRELSQIPKLVIDNRQQIPNYYRQVNQTSPNSVLFKKGYEQQEEIKKLKSENEHFKELLKKQEDQLKQFEQLGDVIEQNSKLKELIMQLEKEIAELKIKPESPQKQNE